MSYFNDIVGMEKLKESVSNMLKFIICAGTNQDHFLNVILTGPPGTGKTTVARMLYNVFSTLDIFGDIDQKFTILGRSDFVGNYLGQSCNKTKKVLEKCKGGVVFIDEFYSMCGDKDDYGRVVLHTINSFISENTDTIFIIAGYENMMEPIYAKQPGLKRRFPWQFHIDKYSAMELFKIFRIQLKKHKWKIRYPKQVLTLFEKNYDKFKAFGGDTINIALKSKMEYSKRNWLYPSCDKRLETNDVREAMKKHFEKQKEEDLTYKSMFI